jgi:diamine N-acetyltransferase
MSKLDLEVTLREITKENWRDIVRLKVAPHQEQFVASNAASIAEAHFNPEVAWFRAIYSLDVPVGFLMLEDDAVQQEYFLWRFMIDEQYQGRGYGRKALELFFAHVKTRPGADAVE